MRDVVYGNHGAYAVVHHRHNPWGPVETIEYRWWVIGGPLGRRLAYCRTKQAAERLHRLRGTKMGYTP